VKKSLETLGCCGDWATRVHTKLNSSSSFVDPGIWSWALCVDPSFFFLQCFYMTFSILCVLWLKFTFGKSQLCCLINRTSFHNAHSLKNVYSINKGFWKWLPFARIKFPLYQHWLVQGKANLGSRGMKHLHAMESLITC